MSDALVPRPDAPPYIPISMQDVWGEVKNRWGDLYSPEKACPVEQYGPVGSASYNSCVQVYDQTWNKIKDELPDYPSGGPYNPPVDLVSVDDICITASMPEDESFPNLFDDLGALAKRLQDSWKRRVAPQYCEPPPMEFPPTKGGCFCLPYMVEVEYEKESPADSGIWIYWNKTQAPVWGPISGVGVTNYAAGTNATTESYEVWIDCQGPEFFQQQSWQCSRSRIRSVIAGGDAGYARLKGVGQIRPLTIAECEAFLGYSPPGYPDLTGECSSPEPQPPPPDYPNTTPYLVPNSPPSFAFPVTGPSCPQEADVLEIKIVYVDGSGPPGADGEKGEDGKAGETTMRRAIKVGPQNILRTEEPIVANDAQVFLPEDCSFIRVDWTGVQSFPKVAYVRQFHESKNNGELDEWQLGRIFLGVQGESGWLAPYIQASKGTSLVQIPDTPGVAYTISVTDVYGVGFSIVDIGYRYRDFRWANPGDIPPIEYQP